MATTAYYERILQEDLNTGTSLTTKRNPGGGTLTATQIGIHSFALGQLKTTQTFTPGEIAAGGYATTTVTVTGAVAGDIVLRSFEAMQAGLLLDAAVTSANTVTVTLANVSGAAVTPASANLHILVLQSK
jgi:hypothetical protein